MNSFTKMENQDKDFLNQEKLIRFLLNTDMVFLYKRAPKADAEQYLTLTVRF